MPRKTQLSQKSLKSPSKSKNVKNQSSTQITLEQSFSRTQKSLENIDELVNNCVRYVLYRAGNNLPIRKPDLQKNVLQHVGRNFDQILDKVTQILKNVSMLILIYVLYALYCNIKIQVYGYELYISDDTSNTKQYLVGNALPYKPGLANVNVNSGEDQNAVPPDVKKILIMLVLTHVFMSNNNVNEGMVTLVGIEQQLNRINFQHHCLPFFVL